MVRARSIRDVAVLQGLGYRVEFRSCPGVSGLEVPGQDPREILDLEAVPAERPPHLAAHSLVEVHEEPRQHVDVRRALWIDFTFVHTSSIRWILD